MRFIKRFLAQFPLYVVLLVLVAIFWGWLFTILTDTAPEKKVSLYADVDEIKDTQLTLKLEEEMPEGVRMVKVHPFSYAMFDEGALDVGDLYLIPASEMEALVKGLRPMEAEEGKECYFHEGQAYGIKVYDAASGEGILKEYVTYSLEGRTDLDYYLCYGAKSVHFGEKDTAAEEIARRLWTLE